MELVKDVFDKFLVNFMYNSLENIKMYFDDETQIKYSTIGEHKGFGEIKKWLTINDDFDVHSSVISNEMGFAFEGNEIILANVSHLLAYEAKNQLFPFLFGGKYEFQYNKVKSKIVNVTFDLEYEFGNTYLAKSEWKWKLYAETGKNRLIGPYSFYKDLADLKSETEKIKLAIHKFLWDIDTKNYNDAEKLVTDDFSACFFEDWDNKEIKGRSEVKKFINVEKENNDQDYHSIRINSVEIKQREALVRAQRLSPNKVGNKHLDSTTKYKLFFNQTIEFRIVRNKDNWLIDKIISKPFTDVETVGYDLLEI